MSKVYLLILINYDLKGLSRLESAITTCQIDARKQFNCIGAGIQFTEISRLIIKYIAAF